VLFCKWMPLGLRHHPPFYACRRCWCHSQLENSSRRQYRRNNSRVMVRPFARFRLVLAILLIGMFGGSRQGMLYTATAFRPLSVAASVCPERRYDRFATWTSVRWELSSNAGLPWSLRPSPWLQLRSGHNHDSSTTVTATSALTNGEIHSNDETVSGFVTPDSTSWNVLHGERDAMYRTMLCVLISECECSRVYTIGTLPLLHSLSHAAHTYTLI
jgi:hypothetical protein